MQLPKPALHQLIGHPARCLCRMGYEVQSPGASPCTRISESSVLCRAAWSPQFFTASLERYAGLMTGCMRVLVGRLAPAAASGEALDIYPLLRDATMVRSWHSLDPAREWGLGA